MTVDTNKSKPIIQILKLQKMGGILMSSKYDKKKNLTQSWTIQQLTKNCKIQKLTKSLRNKLDFWCLQENLKINIFRSLKTGFLNAIWPYL